MNRRLLLSAAMGAFVLGATPALAHHSANAQFDTSKFVEVTGVLKEIRDIRPHAWWTFTVNGADWSFEALGNSQLRRQGILVKDQLITGKPYKITYSPSRDGSKTGFLTAIVIEGKNYVMVRL